MCIAASVCTPINRIFLIMATFPRMLRPAVRRCSNDVGYQAYHLAAQIVLESQKITWFAA
jgi:hypothetical protein